MAIYYTLDTAVEEFTYWCAKCHHYGMDPRKVIQVAEKENPWIYEDHNEPENINEK